MADSQTKVVRPPHYDHFTATPAPSSHECHCGQPATFIDGYYLVNTRRVRVWVCAEHKLGFPTKQLPVPASIQVALDAEKAHLEKMRKHYTFGVEPEKSESVKFLAPTGHGEPLFHDRVVSWRWNGF